MKRFAVITASDSGFAGEREDISGPEAIRMMEAFGYQNIAYQMLPDDKEVLTKAMREIADSGVADLILTTGGTGFSVRDCTPEATKAVIEREVPGIPEAMRWFSLGFTKRAMLSRGMAGIRGNTLIVNLPGSPKAVKECLEYIQDSLDHGLEILLAEASNCAR
ncbi:MAG: MogA/MoaB family molybdenum cofactor biosynthesis protein [Lachnospiraceae bacterium]|nr:MogA/MoaB family molybdenum cofactor biosynthesis protein [Lachnospiraceae bacterium]